MPYDLVVVGYRLNAASTPAQALHEVIGLDIAECKELARKFPATVLTGLNQSRAQELAERLERAGAKVEVRPTGAAGPGASAGASAFPTRSQGGTYELGDILAPISIQKAVPSPAARENPTGRPQPARDSARQSALDVKARGGEHDAAFAGIKNLGDDDLEGFGGPAVPLEVDEDALRPIPRTWQGGAQAAVMARVSLRKRLRSWLAELASSSAEWGKSLALLAVISAVTLLAVGYALNPDDAIGALRLGAAAAEARKAASTLTAP